MGRRWFAHCASCQDKQTDGAMLPNVPMWQCKVWWKSRNFSDDVYSSQLDAPTQYTNLRLVEHCILIIELGHHIGPHGLWASSVKNTWVQVLPRLDWTFENIILVNMSTGSHLYWSCQSFIRNCLERVGLRTVLTPCCVIAFRVLQAVSKPIPKFRGNVIASMPSRCLVTHMLETWTADCISVERVSSHNIREMSSRIELLWLSCSKTCCTFERLWETKHRRWVCCVWSPVCRCRSMLERASH